MATTTDTVILDVNFNDSQLPTQLKWLNPPNKFECQAIGGTGIRIYSNEKSDFWQKTYYEPFMQNDNGHLLYHAVTHPKVVMETTFEVGAVNQFDQGGLMVYLDSDHWIKTGLEYVDGVFRLSCVVTNVYSDWSCQEWAGSSLSLRVWKIGESYVIENYEAKSDKWSFFRIAHLNHKDAKSQEVKMGVFTAAPGKAGTDCVFKYLNIKETQGYHHKSI